LFVGFLAAAKGDRQGRHGYWLFSSSAAQVRQGKIRMVLVGALSWSLFDFFYLCLPLF